MARNALSYLMDHTSTTFTIGKDAEFVGSQPHGSTATEVTKAIRKAL